MAVSKSLKPPRTSRKAPRAKVRSVRKGHPLEALAVMAVLGILSAGAVAWFYLYGYTLYFGDAESHLNHARRIVDSRSAGLDQIGSPWLPLPHLAMAPFVMNQFLWTTGLAGAIPAALAFVIAGGFFYAATRRVFDSRSAALSATALLALNPNLLYVQSIPMTEAFFLAALCAVLYFTVLFRQTQSSAAVIGAGLASMAASMTRYEGWFLIPFVTLYFLTAAQKRRIAVAGLFAAVAALAPLAWLAHNWWHYGDPLEFYRGPYSAKAIYQRALDMNMDRYPGDGDWRLAWFYFRSAAALCAGPVLAYLAFAGVFGAALRRAIWPVLLLALPSVFFVWSLYSSNAPIYMPHLWPRSYYNTRYGLAALPLLAFLAGAIAAAVPMRLRPWIGALTVFLGVLPWIAYPRMEGWICWKESQVNSESRRAWTSEASAYLAERYVPGSGILTSSGDLIGIYRQAGIRLRETLNDGNNPMFMATIARPDLHLREEWVVASSGDAVSTAMLKLRRNGPRYECVRMIAVKGAPVIEIYRRDRPLRRR